MKEIRLCDDAEVSRVLDLCINNNLGIRILWKNVYVI